MCLQYHLSGLATTSILVTQSNGGELSDVWQNVVRDKEKEKSFPQMKEVNFRQLEIVTLDQKSIRKGLKFQLGKGTRGKLAR